MSDNGDSNNGDDVQIEIRLITKLDAYKLPEDPVVVPGSLARLELSEMVNDSLQLADRVPFDFLVDGVYLRGSIIEHCNERGVSSEKTVEVEYVLAMEEPTSEELTEPQSSWISGIVCLGKFFYTASMDGDITKYDAGSGASVTSTKHGILPLCGVCISNGQVLVSASRDGSIQFLDLNDLSCIATGKIASGIQSVNVCPFDESLVMTGSVNGDIHLWNVPTAVNENKSSKKRTIGDIQFRSSIPSSSQSGITGIQWLNLSTVAVGSMDGSIQIIDPLAQVVISNISTNRSISALAALNGSRIATGHPDGRVIFWTVIMSKGNASCTSLEATNACRSHSRMISGLAAKPGSEEMVASTSLDGSVKIFDCRASSYAIQSVELPESVRGLSLAWSSSNTLLSGASDGVVRTHRLE